MEQLQTCKERAHSALSFGCGGYPLSFEIISAASTES